MSLRPLPGTACAWAGRLQAGFGVCNPSGVALLVPGIPVQRMQEDSEECWGG